MDIKVESAFRVSTIFLTGRFDAHTTEAFRAAVGTIQDGQLTIDLAEVTFIDSRGLAALINVYHRFGSALKLRSPQDAVKLIFEVTNLDQVFPFESLTP